MPDALLRPVAGGQTAVAVARALLEAGSVTARPESPVTFTSGLRSPVYVDNRRLISQPGPWRVVVEALVAAIRAEGPPIEVVAGVESSGIPHSSAAAYAAGLPAVFVRKPATSTASAGASRAGTWPAAGSCSWRTWSPPAARASRRSRRCAAPALPM